MPTVSAYCAGISLTLHSLTLPAREYLRKGILGRAWECVINLDSNTFAYSTSNQISKLVVHRNYLLRSEPLVKVQLPGLALRPLAHGSKSNRSAFANGGVTNYVFVHLVSNSPLKPAFKVRTNFGCTKG